MNDKDRDRPRWAQLTYGSLPADTATGASAGWRVKETRGAPNEEEMQELISFAVTRFESHVPFPGVGQRSEVYEALPRRFGYTHLNHAGVYWHAAQVDADGAGRAGNVFSHLILDRDPDVVAERHHPISLWRSPDLLSPHQYGNIAASTLPDAPPDPGAEVTRQNILDFLFDPGYWRIGTLAVLVDAACAALAGGPRVVLHLDDQREVALWIGAVSALLSLADARRLGFSLYERSASDHGNSVERAFARGVLIAAVPRSDAVQLERDVIVLDPHTEITVGSPGESHELPGGFSIPAGPASQLVTLSMFTRDDAAVHMDGIDSIARRTGDATMLDPMWPLAMSILLLRTDYPDAAAVAEKIVVRATPASAGADAELRDAAEGATQRALSTEPSALWQHLRHTPPASYTYQLIASTYLAHSVTNPTWLTAETVAPVPFPPPTSIDAFLPAAQSALTTALEQPPDLSRTLARLRLVGFVTRALEGRPTVPALEERLADLAAQEVELLAKLGTGAVSAAAAAQLDDATLTTYVIPALDARTVMSPVSVYATPPAVLRALFGRSPLLQFSGAAPRTPFEWDALALDVESTGDLARAQLLTTQYLSRYGKWGAVPADGAAVMAIVASSWSGSELIRVTSDELTGVPVQAIINGLMRSTYEEAARIKRLPGLHRNLAHLASTVQNAKSIENFRAPVGTIQLSSTPATDAHMLERLVGSLSMVLHDESLPAPTKDAALRSLAPAVTALTIATMQSPALNAPPRRDAQVIQAAIRTVKDNPDLAALTLPYLDARAREASLRAITFVSLVAAVAASADELSKRPGDPLRPALTQILLPDGSRLLDVIAERGIHGNGDAAKLDAIALAKQISWYFPDDRALPEKLAKKWMREHGPKGPGFVENIGGFLRRQKGDD
ncbi:hypothetical protein [Microbacterium sp. NPDC076895]|uniref:GAP1-N2 domain-containing protein n=1 Tax=Microbacterium sp. NPDC076895 TaxID=3154957 RepID=UPI0034465D54